MDELARILFPIDGSEATLRAVDRGLAMLRPGKDATVTFLVVVSKGLRDMPADAREYLEFDDEDELFIRDDEAKAVLDKAVAIAKRHKVSNVKPLVRIGKVKETILAECKAHDLLVMHALRRDEREDKRHGNTTEELARGGGCHVLLVQAD